MRGLQNAAQRCKKRYVAPYDSYSILRPYCREVGAILAEQSIRDFAKALRYIPGSFAEIVRSTFVSRPMP